MASTPHSYFEQGPLGVAFGSHAGEHAPEPGSSVVQVLRSMTMPVHWPLSSLQNAPPVPPPSFGSTVTVDAPVGTWMVATLTGNFTNGGLHSEPLLVESEQPSSHLSVPSGLAWSQPTTVQVLSASLTVDLTHTMLLMPSVLQPLHGCGEGLGKAGMWGGDVGAGICGGWVDKGASPPPQHTNPTRAPP